MRDRGASHSRRFNSTTVNMTLTSRTEGDFHNINKPLCDKPNEPEHCDKEDKIFYPYDKESTNHKTDSNLWYFIVVMLVYFF